MDYKTKVMDEILEQIKRYLNETPQDVLEKKWNEKNYLDDIGPDISEYVQYVHENYKYDTIFCQKVKYNFQDTPFSECSNYFKVA